MEKGRNLFKTYYYKNACLLGIITHLHNQRLIKISISRKHFALKLLKVQPVEKSGKPDSFKKKIHPSIVSHLFELCVCWVLSVVSNCLWLYGPWFLQAPWPWFSRQTEPGVGCHFFLLQIFLTQGSNPLLCLLHWQEGSLPHLFGAVVKIAVHSLLWKSVSSGERIKGKTYCNYFLK